MGYKVEISRIHIKNFRSIVDATLDFDNFNIFVGLNDCGKSNVLKALNLFFNGETENGQPLDFPRDYCQHGKTGKGKAKEIVIEISIKVPDDFSEAGIKVWKKVWRDNDLFSDNLTTLFKPYSKCVTLFKRIRFEYVPAVKSEDFFQSLLLKLYNSMTHSADSLLIKANTAYSKSLSELTQNLSQNIKEQLGIDSTVRMPDRLAVLFRNLKINTNDANIKNIDLNHRGDGIKARHIPSILLTICNNIKASRKKNSVDYTFIWGYEEPENGVEFFSCAKLADELYLYSKENQIILTTHSPAIYSRNCNEHVKCYYAYKDEHGNSIYEQDYSTVELNENIGLMPLIAPYIEEFQKELDSRKEKMITLKSEVDRLKEETGRVIVYTEGTTDVIILKKAIEKLQIKDLRLDIRAAAADNGKHNDDAVKRLLIMLQHNLCTNNIVIGLFDRDAVPPIEFSDVTGEKVNLINANDGFIKLKDHIFAFTLPVPHNRPEIDQISIEHYFTDDEITTENENHQRLFMGKEFYPSGNHIDDNMDYNYHTPSKTIYGTIRIIEHEQNRFVTDRKGNGDFSLSKQRFAEAIRDNRPGFENFDFSEFSKIFDVIRRIVAADQKE